MNTMLRMDDAAITHGAIVLYCPEARVRSRQPQVNPRGGRMAGFWLWDLGISSSQAWTKMVCFISSLRSHSFSLVRQSRKIYLGISQSMMLNPQLE